MQRLKVHHADHLFRINHVESQIGAGLIEEIIQIAEGESELVDRLYESKV